MVAALFVRSDSHYHNMPGVDAYDFNRNALTWLGGCPVVAHPPCRSWGKLRHFAKPREGEKELTLWAADQVRKYGGVLEHPLGSQIRKAANLPQPGKKDSFGGFLLGVNQSWWGHRAEKATLLYIVGCSPSEIPPIPYSLNYAETTVENLSRRQREMTPLSFAEWLVELAARCKAGQPLPLGFITCSQSLTEVENG